MRRLLASIFVLVSGAAGVVAGAPTASAACSYPWSNPSNWTAVTVGDDVNYRSGPWRSCSSNGTWNSGSDVYLHCYRVGEKITAHGVTSPLWWHVRKAGTQQQGYISESFLRSNGWILPHPPASHQC
ncbi:hypothetical protein ACGFNF_26555 [Micromonospora sp. NPDC048868]|uniref:hypothetical protein n=1 Tax=Micromonospora sp. NPDC048868 TaxID=3364258 RepID=UPI0037109D7D